MGALYESTRLRYFNDVKSICWINHVCFLHHVTLCAPNATVSSVEESVGKVWVDSASVAVDSP